MSGFRHAGIEQASNLPAAAGRFFAYLLLSQSRAPRERTTISRRPSLKQCFTGAPGNPAVIPAASPLFLPFIRGAEPACLSGWACLIITLPLTPAACIASADADAMNPGGAIMLPGLYGLLRKQETLPAQARPSDPSPPESSGSGIPGKPHRRVASCPRRAPLCASAGRARSGASCEAPWQSSAALCLPVRLFARSPVKQENDPPAEMMKKKGFVLYITSCETAEPQALTSLQFCVLP